MCATAVDTFELDFKEFVDEFSSIFQFCNYYEEIEFPNTLEVIKH